MKTKLEKYASIKTVIVGASNAVQITKHIQSASCRVRTGLAAMDAKMSVM